MKKRKDESDKSWKKIRDKLRSDNIEIRNRKKMKIRMRNKNIDYKIARLKNKNEKNDKK